MLVTTTLKELGLSEKEIQIYLALLGRGPSSVRELATETRINRGTTYDLLKSLMAQSLVSYYHQETKQYFVAEDPIRLEQVVTERTQDLERTKATVFKIIPELQAMRAGEAQPVVKYYTGGRGIKTMLEDVLATMAKADDSEYYVYSTADVREHLYQDFPDFVEKRINQKISVKTIAIGKGGKLWGLDDRRWISKRGESPAYQIIYDTKLALISLDKHGQAHGVIIEDASTASTQRLIFKTLWDTLSQS